MLEIKFELQFSGDRSLNMEIKRDLYLNKLIVRKRNGLIKVITGVRRCGKSYLLNNIFYRRLLADGVGPDHIIRFAFDSADDLLLIGENLIKLQKANKKVNPEKFMAYIRTKIVDEEVATDIDKADLV